MSEPRVRSNRRPPPALRRAMLLALTIVPGAMLGVTAWEACGRYGERCREAGQLFPVHGPGGAADVVVMRDSTGNGIIDTWVSRTPSGVRRIEVDLDEDGVTDRRLVFDEAVGQWRLDTGSVEAESVVKSSSHP